MTKRKNSKRTSFEEFLDMDNEVVEECFIDGELDLSGQTVTASFSFGSHAESSEHICSGQASHLWGTNYQPLPGQAVLEQAVQAKTPAAPAIDVQTNASLIDNRKLQTQAYGRTPAVDGEPFDVNRTFLFRRSTVRLLNWMKAEHPDVNVYLSTIVDEALRYYYEHVFKHLRS